MLRVADFQLSKPGIARYVLAAALLLQAVVIGSVILSVRASRRPDRARTTLDGSTAAVWQNHVASPVVRPSTFQAKDATLRLDEFVIGLEVGGTARAYRVAAFDYPRSHLVNDLIGGVPVSVSYCNLTRCVRIYTDPKGTAPLDVEVAGLVETEMIVKLRGNLYFQRSGEPVDPGKSPATIPYELLTPTLTTWQEWRQQHPGTDVYIGDHASDRRSRSSAITDDHQEGTLGQQPRPNVPKREQIRGDDP